MAERDPNDNEAGPRDDDAAWAQIVASYDAKPEVREDGTDPWPESENVPEAPDGPDEGTADKDTASASVPEGPASTTGAAVGSFIVFAPGVGGAGPRDWDPAEPSEDDFDDTDEGHFVPPEPPPLPESDATARFAWIGFIGGPLLMIGLVVFRVELNWWLTTLSVGGFLGGLVTLVMRMRDDDEEDDDPGRGAVV